MMKNKETTHRQQGNDRGVGLSGGGPWQVGTHVGALGGAAGMMSCSFSSVDDGGINQ